MSTDFYLPYRGASYHSNLDSLVASLVIIRFKAITDPNLLKHAWNTKVHNCTDSDGRKPRDEDLATF